MVTTASFPIGTERCGIASKPSLMMRTEIPLAGQRTAQPNLPLVPTASIELNEASRLCGIALIGSADDVYW